MKKIGVVSLDEMGRVAVPKEFIKILKLDDEKLLCMHLQGERLILSRYSPLKMADASVRRVCSIIAQSSDCGVIAGDLTHVTACSGVEAERLLSKKISKEFRELIIKNAVAVLSKKDGATVPAVCERDGDGFASLVVAPISEDGVPVGFIALVSAAKSMHVNDCNVKAIRIARELIQSGFDSEKCV